MLRIYTRITFWNLLFCKPRIIQWHQTYLAKFYNMWQVTHKPKILKSIRTKEKPSFVINNDANPNQVVPSPTSNMKQEGDDDRNRVNVDTICPFAMIAPPEL